MTNLLFFSFPSSRAAARDAGAPGCGARRAALAGERRPRRGARFLAAPHEQQPAARGAQGLLVSSNIGKSRGVGKKKRLVFLAILGSQGVKIPRGECPCLTEPKHTDNVPLRDLLCPAVQQGRGYTFTSAQSRTKGSAGACSLETIS